LMLIIGGGNIGIRYCLEKKKKKKKKKEKKKEKRWLARNWK